MSIISVIGGTGMLGAPVAKQLKADGYQVRIISRNSQKAKEQLGGDFEYRQADLQDVSSLRLALAGSDCVHINASGQSKKSYYQNHVVGTRNILAALQGQSLTAISMISTASAYPEYDDRWDNRYKLEAEALLKESGHPYLVFMPSWFMESLPLFQQKNKLIHIGPSTQPIHWLSAKDYAKTVSNALQDNSCRNLRMPIYGPEGITMKEAVNRYAKVAQLTVQTMPVWLAKTLGFILRDESLIDAADLMKHYDRIGEQAISHAVRTETKLDQWLGQVL
ncbi:SDR family oxidoreductase [Reinekea sp.]|jgi:uncharacterized protein YbjT (DUF2867 family)|uniref:SDR family oxidoreductase n=1 Tax=Reinekea sp. TaxID=1970455 RepID=UPI00398A0BC6